MMEPKHDDKDIEEWLRTNEGFTRIFVEKYIHTHPLLLKELIQDDQDKKQLQQLNSMGSNSLTLPISHPLTPQKTLKHVHSVPNVNRRKSAQELRLLNKQELFMELLKDVVSPEFDANSLSHKILVNVLLLTNSDRSSLFLVEGSGGNPILVSRLFDVTENSTLHQVVHDESDAIKIPIGVGIVGQVAETGTSIILEDAYSVCVLQLKELK